MIKKCFLILMIGGIFLTACNSLPSSDVTIDEPLSPSPLETKLPAPIRPNESPTESEDFSPTDSPDPETATLMSLKQVDDYPLYTMTYYADYDIAALEQILLPVNSQLNPAESWACSLFAALADPASRLYGRNFDWEFSPALLLYTDPPDGYASVAMVDIAYLGFAGDRSANLTEKPLDELAGLLAAPYLPFDGFNEAGLAIGMAAVSPGNVPADPDKATLGSLRIIRAVLDGAATVEQALEILQSYNIDFEGGPSIHYLVADAQGRAALLEHQGGEIHILFNEQPWHQATNFLNSAFESQDGQCWRYDTISAQMETTQGMLTPASAMNLLQNVSQGSTQWSVIYGISTGEIHVALGGDYQSAHIFQLDMLTPNSKE
jgi:hypothetical protein